MTTLADLDDDFATAGRRKPVATLPQQWLANGIYTIRFSCGTHKTIRVHTQQLGPMAGRRLLSLLIGPDNSTDYETFAELTPYGVFVWKRFKNARQAAYAELLMLLAKGEKIEDHELMVSKRCMRCNRLLTDDVSITAGLGPECRRLERA